MSSSRRVSGSLVCAAALAMVAFMLLQGGHARAGSLTYRQLNKIQRRLISGALMSEFAPSGQQGVNAATLGGGDDNGGGPDGAANTPPASFAGASAAAGALGNYFPAGSQSNCSVSLGADVKVNQNCVNVTDADLQGRGQANNEAFISQDPLHPSNIVASDNNYLRGDGTCGAYYSIDGGSSWADATTPNGFTRGANFGAFARQYWQAGGDTSVAWDTRGNSYLSCQLFDRGNVATANPDMSSGFVVFRSTGNHGASFDFPGHFTTSFFDPTGTAGVLEDKALMAVDNTVGSPFQDRIYVTWTEFAADGTAYVYEVHSSDYGQTFSPRVLVSADSSLCANNYGLPTPNGNCNENQYSDPFIGRDGALYVAYANFNNGLNSATDNHNQFLLAKSTDGGASFSAPVLVSNYYDLPDCNTYQGAGADSFRACVPEKGSSTKSVFRAINYPSGAVDPHDPSKVVVTFGSYINKDSNEANGCAPAGFAANGDNAFTGVKTAGACANKILLSVSTDGGATFTGTATDPRAATVVPQRAAQASTDQFFQWAAFTRNGTLAVDFYDRSFGDDETTGASDFGLAASNDLTHFTSTRVTSSSMPPPTEFEGPDGGQFMGDYTGLTAVTQAHPIWSDTRSQDVFVCPGTSTGPGNPPQLCGGTEPNGLTANDEDTVTATVGVPGNGQ